MKCPNYLYLAIAAILISSCSTQTAEVLEPTVTETQVPVEAKPRNTTCTTLDDLDPSIRSSTEDAYTPVSYTHLTLPTTPYV